MIKKNIGCTLCAIAAASVMAFGVTACGGEKATTTTPLSEGTQQEQPSEPARDDSKEQDSTEDLAVGTTVSLPSGLSVTVDAVETGLSNYDGSTVTGVHVTYVNNGDDGESYNVFDWKGEDVNGAQQSTTYYSEASDELNSGTLAKGGTVSGNLYFEGDIVKALYFGNILEKGATASWSLS